MEQNFILKGSLRKKLGALTIIVSGIYMTILPMAFPHLAFCISVLLFPVLILDWKKVTPFCLISFLFVFLLILHQLNSDSSWKGAINYISTVLVFPCVIFCLYDASESYLKKISYWFIKLSIIILLIECITRLAISFRSSGGDIFNFYYYKMNSFMFFDTNFTGLFILVLIFYIRYYSCFIGNDLSKFNKSLIVLCLLTFSRAAILAAILSFFLFYGVDKTNFKKKLFSRIFYLLILSSFFGVFIYMQLYEDPSFRSKIVIFDIFVEQLGEIKDALWLGVGIGQSQELLGIYAHNMFILYILELGVVGTIINFLFIIFILIKTKYRLLIVYIPFLIAAQSAYAFATHYLYATFALIYLFENIKLQKKVE